MAGKLPTLLTCPNPECERTCDPKLQPLAGVAHYVWCKSCGMTGPERYTQREAIQDWNALPRPEPQLRIVCAWCKTVKQEGTPGGGVTHGICMDCIARHFPDQLEEVRQDLAAIAAAGQDTVRTGRDRSRQEVAS